MKFYHYFSTPKYRTVNCGSTFELFRYNCNRYDEDEAKKARDAQEVMPFLQLQSVVVDYLSHDVL